MYTYLRSPGKFESSILHAEGIFGGFNKFSDLQQRLNIPKIK
jgi:hypothetical protein